MNEDHTAYRKHAAKNTSRRYNGTLLLIKYTSNSNIKILVNVKSAYIYEY